MIAALRNRWGGGLRPSMRVARDDQAIERWDGEGCGPGRVIIAEGFGITFTLFIGRTPKKRGRS
jgi:hypothetical protein